MPARYSGIAIFFHWLVGFLIIGLLAVGLIMEDLPDSIKFTVYGWHKAFGIIVLALVTLRFTWRMITPPPALPETMDKRQILLSKIAHIALYGLMFAMPVIGWMMSSAGGYPVSVFGIPVPPLAEKNKELMDLMKELHEVGGNLLIVLIVLHLGAAFYHQRILKDGLMARMLPACCKDKN